MKTIDPWDADLTIEYNGREPWIQIQNGLDVAGVPVDVPGGADQWAKFFQTAPKMARALLLNGTRNYGWSRGGGWHTYDCWKSRHALNTACSEACKATRAALKAAGVPIP